MKLHPFGPLPPVSILTLGGGGLGMVWGATTATLRRAEGVQAAGTDDRGQVIVKSAPVSMGRAARVTEAREYRFFAGWRSDPFFFDTQGALNNLQFTGNDFFADKDVCSIVLEVPNSDLGTEPIDLWARTLVKGGGGWVQADRGARPAQAVFLVGTNPQTEPSILEWRRPALSRRKLAPSNVSGSESVATRREKARVSRHSPEKTGTPGLVG
jgi:hypothetical protein